MEEESWERDHGREIKEEDSSRRNNGEESWGRNCGEKMEGKSWANSSPSVPAYSELLLPFSWITIDPCLDILTVGDDDPGVPWPPPCGRRAIYISYYIKFILSCVTKNKNRDKNQMKEQKKPKANFIHQLQLQRTYNSMYIFFHKFLNVVR